MTLAHDIATPPSALYDALAAEGFGPTIFNPTQHRACHLVDQYALELAIELVRSLDPEAVPAFAPARAWLHARLRSAGIDPDGPLPSTDRASIREACLALDPGFEPAFALLDEAAKLYPRVARGETSGERALFLRVSLWAAYFDNRNTYYALNNRVTASTVARLATGGPPAHVLELGAGLGSATTAILDACAAAGVSMASYRATEPVVFFRRRAERTLATTHPATSVTWAPLDIDASWAESGVAPGAATVVAGVNVMHLARNLRHSLAEAHAALAPGGWLVLGEAVRATPDQVVGAELPFQILERFHHVDCDSRHRPTPGFLTPDAWEALVTEAGFVDVAIRPDPRRLPGGPFGSFTVAVCGRRRPR